MEKHCGRNFVRILEELARGDAPSTNTPRQRWGKRKAWGGPLSEQYGTFFLPRAKQDGSSEEVTVSDSWAGRGAEGARGRESRGEGARGQSPCTTTQDECVVIRRRWRRCVTFLLFVS